MAAIRKRVLGVTVANTAAGVTKLKDVLVSAGWTVLDDQFTASNYYIMKSTGEITGKYFPIILQIMHSSTADTLTCFTYTYWDTSTHTGINRIGSSAYNPGADDDAAFYMWIFANKDSVVFFNKVGSYAEGISIGYFAPAYDRQGVLQSAVTAGDDKVLTFASGEADNFVKEGTMIVGVAGEGQRKLTIASVDAANDQITVDNLPIDFAAGAYVGPTPYPIVIQSNYNGTIVAVYGLYRLITTNASSSGYITAALLFGTAYGDPEGITGKYLLVPSVITDTYSTTAGLYGFKLDYFLTGDINIAGNEDTIGVSLQESGTSTGSNTTTTLNDTGASFTVDGLIGKGVVITGGTGAGQIREITDNTGTQMTVDEAWDITPDATSTYKVYKSVWVAFCPTSAVAFFCKAIGV